MVLNMFSHKKTATHRKRLKHKLPEQHDLKHVIALILNEIYYVFLCIFDIRTDSIQEKPKIYE